jgi:hypothetical protein
MFAKKVQQAGIYYLAVGISGSISNQALKSEACAKNRYQSPPGQCNESYHEVALQVLSSIPVGVSQIPELRWVRIVTRVTELVEKTQLESHNYKQDRARSESKGLVSDLLSTKSNTIENRFTDYEIFWCTS